MEINQEASVGIFKNLKLYPGYYFNCLLSRFFAYIIDSIIANAISKILLTPIFLIFGLNISTEKLSAYSVLSIIIYLAYFAVSTYYTKGQTIGKIICDIKVVSLDEDRLNVETVLVREVAIRYICYKIPILYLIVFFSSKHQSLADIFSDTAVVSLNMEKLEHFFEINK